MKLSLLSGAYKNAGDFLIVERCKKLLSYVYPDCEIIEYARNKDLTENLGEINKTDCLILAGGPAYTANIYPNQIPLVPDLNKIKTPIFAMALGFKGTGKEDLRYTYYFGEKTQSLWKRIENDGFALGCRDWNSVDLLCTNGIKRTAMTGCAAWYNLTQKDSTENSRVGGKKIIISDPANVDNFLAAFELIKYLSKRFPDCEIVFVFHRGIGEDKFTSAKQGRDLERFICILKKAGISYIDISYGADGLKIYDDCKLHVGFRVHAHIYTLSMRRPSILIEEDLRGNGVNSALGLPSIKANNEFIGSISNRYAKRITKMIFKPSNPNLINFINSAIEYYDETDNQPVEWAFKRIDYYFNTMIEHLQSIGKITGGI